MGRLIDADVCLSKAWQNFFKQEDEHEKDIDDYDIMRDRFYEQSGFGCCQQTIVNAPTVEAIPIPEGATNGDMIRALYPNALIEKWNEYGTVRVWHDIYDVNYSMTWWNSPYKESEDALN